MKAFLYLRVSSEEQAKHGYSLDAQETALLDFCATKDHIVVGIYRDEGISGRKPYNKRPAMVQLLQDLETVKPDIILFTKLDRWFRNIREYYKVQDILDRNKVDWKAINEEYDTSTASGRLYVNIKLSIAQDEADRTSERIKDIQGQLVAQGKVLGGKVPLGYKIVDKRVVFSDDIHITKDAINYYMMTGSLHSTCQHINDTYGFQYTPTHIKNLFRSTLLKGEYRNNASFCQPLITSEQWDALQVKIGNNIRHASYRIYLFSGLLKCPVCGRNLGGCTSTATYYRCVRQTHHACTFKNWINEEAVEKWLLENVEEDFRVKVTMKPKEKREDPKKYKDRLERLNKVYVMGNISDADYRKQSAELQQKIAELSKNAPLKTQILDANWKEIYAKLDSEHRRNFWHNLIKEIRVTVENKGFEVLY